MATIKDTIRRLTDGVITFEQALAEFRTMPIPQRPPRPNSVVEMYERAEEWWPGDDDFFWIDCAQSGGTITATQRLQIYRWGFQLTTA